MKMNDSRYRNGQASSHTVVVASLTFKFEFKHHDIIILIDMYADVCSFHPLLFAIVVRR